MQPDEVSLDVPVASIDGPLLVETEAGRTFVSHHVIGGGQHRLSAHLPDGRERSLNDVPADRTLRDAVASLASARPLRAFRVPGIIKSRTNPARFLLAYLPMAAGLAMAITGFAWESLGIIRFALMAVGVMLFIFTRDALGKGKRHRQWAIQHDDEKVLAIDVPLPDMPDDIEVDDVKAEYGRLLSDIVYRIEYPALFDPHEPTSKAFTLALLQWDNNDGVVGDDEKRELARRVRSTFEAARANAERIGMQHIPEESRTRATTALKAARLAVDESSPEAERETALRRAVEILDGLALYYLPSGAEARKAITGGTPPQLPGRRSG